MKHRLTDVTNNKHVRVLNLFLFSDMKVSNLLLLLLLFRRNLTCCNSPPGRRRQHRAHSSHWAFCVSEEKCVKRRVYVDPNPPPAPSCPVGPNGTTVSETAQDETQNTATHPRSQRSLPAGLREEELPLWWKRRKRWDTSDQTSFIKQGFYYQRGWFKNMWRTSSSSPSGWKLWMSDCTSLIHSDCTQLLSADQSEMIIIHLSITK